MQEPPKIQKLDEVVVNRIAAGEIIQRPANALKELIENSLDAKASNIQVTVKEGGLKLLQIQDNGTGIRKEDMDIVCERFTTSKLQKFDDLKSIATFGFRGEALASISHVALLTITTKTAVEKCGYRASYIDSKLRAPPKACAANQGTTILIENLFYNVVTRRKALASPAEEFAKIADVMTRYAVHNANVGFTLKKHNEVIAQVRTPHNSTKINNVKILYGNPVARELVEVEHDDDTYKFKMHALVTNPNYSSKRMTFLLFINHRLVDSTPIRKMLEELYSIYLPKKTFPWCYISLEIIPSNVDVNVHPTKHEVRFLHEEAIIEKVKFVLDEKLSGNNASRTFYLQARLPQVDITKDTLKEVLPEYDKDNSEQAKKIHPREMIRTSSSDQKLDKFNFTVHNVNEKNTYIAEQSRDLGESSLRDNTMDPEDKRFELKTDNEDFESVMGCSLRPLTVREAIMDFDESTNIIGVNNCNKPQRDESKGGLLPIDTPRTPENAKKQNNTHWSSIVDEMSSAESINVFSMNLQGLVTSTQVEKTTENNVAQSIPDLILTEDESSSDAPPDKPPVSEAAARALKTVYHYYGNHDDIECTKKRNNSADLLSPNSDTVNSATNNDIVASKTEAGPSSDNAHTPSSIEFKSYSVNTFRYEVKLRSILSLRKEIEDNYHEGLREIISNMIFVGSVDEKSALIQSGLNLYICDTKKLAEELFYEIMLYDFANYGIFKFSEPLPLEELALLGLETEEAGWSEEEESKEGIAGRVKELLLEKADMLKEYFSIVIDKNGNLKSLPVLLDKYFPYEAELPLYILRLSTEVDWTSEKPCFNGICRETAKFFSHINTNTENQDWKHIIEHVLYVAIKDSLLPPKHFAHDSTILQIASLPDLYKVFERC